MTGGSLPSGAEASDADLVGRCRAGEREAFGQIVGRYQALVCALAYSACGSFTQSEDVAQEVFLRAWRQLGALREPERLKEWLAGIARRAAVDAYRRNRREPSLGGEDLPAEAASPEPLPSELTARREEEQLLWRALEQVPASYREALVLYYRERRSIEHVAVALDLSEENVRQRLSRGRRALQEEVARMLEGTLAATQPGAAFTAAVMTSLPPLTALGTAGAAGSAAKGGALKALLLGSWAAGALIAAGGMIAQLRAAPTPGERRRIVTKWSILWTGGLLFAASFWLMARQSPAYWEAHAAERNALWIGPALVYGVAVGLYCWSCAAGDPTIPPGEFISRRRLFGRPLLHVRFGAGPARGWIAVGDEAYGWLFACGHMAVAPVACGVIATGGVALGGWVCGGFAFGFVAIGAAALGGLAAGLWAYGGTVFGWVAAVGGAAHARAFALGAGGFTAAAHANDAAAQAAASRILVLQHAPTLLAVCLVVSWLPLFATLAWRRRAR